MNENLDLTNTDEKSRKKMVKKETGRGSPAGALYTI